jgi:hypothetical protein
VSGAIPGRPRRERTAAESLLSIVLVLEAIVVFFVALTVYGLEQLPAGIALGGGAALILILALGSRMVRSPIGLWIGWALQGVLVLLGLVNPVMWVVGAGFAGLWVFCFVRGRQLDRAKAAYRAAYPGSATPVSRETEAPHPDTRGSNIPDPDNSKEMK